MKEIRFEKEVCDYLKLPKLPVKEWDGKTAFDKGVAIVKLAFDEKAYAVAKFNPDVDSKPNVVKVFASETFFDIEKVFIVPDYMEMNVENADLDDESKKKAEELARQAEEIENDGVSTKVEMPENEYSFDNIHNDEEAIAFITAYNQKNGIKGAVPKKHDTIVMRLAVIYDETQKASGINDATPAPETPSGDNQGENQGGGEDNENKGDEE